MIMFSRRRGSRKRVCLSKILTYICRNWTCRFDWSDTHRNAIDQCSVYATDAQDIAQVRQPLSSDYIGMSRSRAFDTILLRGRLVFEIPRLRRDSVVFWKAIRAWRPRHNLRRHTITLHLPGIQGRIVSVRYIGCFFDKVSRLLACSRALLNFIPYSSCTV